MGEKGLRVLAFAARVVDEHELPRDDGRPDVADPRLGFVGMVGIIDPLRAEAKAAVEIALRAGIDVRMITGDHAVTAQAIGEIAGPRDRGRSAAPSCRRCPTRSWRRRLPKLHVFGRVTPGGQAAPGPAHAAARG